MNLKKAVNDFLESRNDIRGIATYRSAAKTLMLTLNLGTIDLAGDLVVSERKRRIRKTRELFERIENKLKGKSQNTRFFTLNLLKIVLRFVEENTGMVFWKQYKIKQHLKDIVILDLDFVKRFVSDIDGKYNTMPVSYQSLHTLVSVILTTTLRISDALSLRPEHFKDGKVLIKNQKTGAITACPIPDTLRKRIENNVAKTGNVYECKLHKHTAYRILDEFLRQYPAMRKEVNGEPFYSMITFHNFRKTAISVMLAFGVPQSVVMAASGHSVGSKSFQRYVTNVEKVFDQEINSFQNKFYGDD